MKQSSHEGWTVRDAVRHYGIDRWGDGYFSVNESGNVTVTPSANGGDSIDLKSLVDRLRDRGLRLPILVRFNGILSDRLRTIHDSFATAIDEFEYANRYCCVYPVKVNQQRDVVRQIVAEGSKLGFGIEAGSKPELLAAIAMGDESVPIVCNGFKDQEFVRLAMMAQRLGRRVFPVIEKASELDLVFRVAAEIGVRPSIGMRVKLATRGSGRWNASGGYRSKFGLTVAEVLAALDRMIQNEMADCFQMLHFHVGSQIGNIRQLKSAILEAARIYVDLKSRGAAMGYLDVGGGLGVDYEGTRSDSDSSMNYSMQEYANDVVYHVKSVCDDAGVDHPQLISESGRAVAAHHSVLIVETLGVTKQGDAKLPDWAQQGTAPPEHYEQPVQDLWLSYQELSTANMMEVFHDAQLTLDMCINLFGGGYLPLEQRVAAENLYFALCHRVREIAQRQGELPEELMHLDRMLSDIYFVNFSLFQSVPDAWAIDHLFPIMPIHRLDESPSRHAVLGDITCDSDGKVDSFVSGSGRQETLRLHPLREGESYQLGIFLVGAYQEILGDLHNLFGDTDAAHVECDGSVVKIRSVVKGDSVSEVLGYVQYDDRELMSQISQAVEDAVSDSRIDNHQAGQIVSAFETALMGYTYLGTERETVRRDADESVMRIDVAHDPRVTLPVEQQSESRVHIAEDT